MAKLPFGFDPKQPYLHDDGLHDGSTEAASWAMLQDVQTYLEEGKPLPPELATWLGLAIEFSKPNRELGRDGSSTEFLQRLGLATGRGKGKKTPKNKNGTLEPTREFNRYFKAHWQGRLWHLGTYNETMFVNQVVEAIKAEMTAEGLEEQPSRSTLQDWLSEALNGSKRAR